MAEEQDPEDISLSRETLSGTTAKVATTVVGFLGTIVFARVLGPTGFGSFFILLSISAIIVPALVGWALAGKKRFSEQVTEQRRSEIVGALFLFAIALSVLVSGVSIIVSNPLIEYVGVKNAPLLLVILFVTSGVYETLVHISQGRGKVGVSMWAGTVKEILMVPAQLVLVLLGLHVTGMVVGQALAVIAIWPLLFYYTDVRPSIPSKETITSLWSYAKYSIPNSVLGMVYSQFDVLLLAAILSPAAAGYYEAAFRISTPALFVSSTTAAALLPRVSNLLDKGTDPTEDIQHSLSFTSLLSFPLVFGAFALSREVVTTVYGADFAPARTLLIGLAIYHLVRSQSTVLTSVAEGLDRPDIITRVSATALVCNIIVGAFLTIEFGPIGVVIATILAESIRYLWLVRFAAKRFPWSALYPRPVFEQLSASILMFGGLVTMIHFLGTNSLTHIVFIIVVGGTIYFTALFTISNRHRETALEAVSQYGIR